MIQKSYPNKTTPSRQAAGVFVLNPMEIRRKKKKRYHE